MSNGVQFEEDVMIRPGSNQPSVLYAHFQKSNDTPRIIRLVLKSKIVKSEQQAQALILVLLVIMLCLMAYFFYKSASGSQIVELKFK